MVGPSQYLSTMQMLILESRDTDWRNRLKQKKTHLFASYKNAHFINIITHRLKVKGWKKVFHANGKEK